MVQIEINSDLRTEIAVHYTETRWRHQGLCELLDSDRMAQIIANKISSSSAAENAGSVLKRISLERLISISKPYEFILPLKGAGIVQSID